MSNFQFLESHWTDLAKLGDLSEKYVYSDPNTSIIKQGMLSEVMVKYMLDRKSTRLNSSHSRKSRMPSSA